VKDLSDGTNGDDVYTITSMHPHTGQNLEEVVTEENSEPSVEEEQPQPTQSEGAIPDSSYQGETNSGHAVLEGMEEVRPESRDKQDPPTQDDQRFNRALLNRNLGLSERGTNQPC